MRMRESVGLALLFAALLTACGGGGGGNVAAPTVTAEYAGPPTAERGAQIFEDPGPQGTPCARCHSLDGSSLASSYTSASGPTLLGISERAGSIVPGVSAEEYIRESILDPLAYLPEGWTDTMPKFYGTTLTEEQVESLVAFLLTK